MNVSTATIRRRVNASIAAALAPTGWQASTVPYDLFGSGEGDNLLHKCYAVGCTETKPTGTKQQASVTSETDLRVRWAYDLAALNQADTYDDALEAAGAMIAAVMRVQTSGGVTIAWQSSTHPVDDEGRMMGEIVFIASHTIGLV